MRIYILSSVRAHEPSYKARDINKLSNRSLSFIFDKPVAFIIIDKSGYFIETIIENPKFSKQFSLMFSISYFL